MDHFKFFLYLASLFPSVAVIPFFVVAHLKSHDPLYRKLAWYYAAFAVNAALSLSLMYVGTIIDPSWEHVAIALLLFICVTAFALINLAVRMTHFVFSVSWGKVVEWIYLVVTFFTYLGGPIFFAGVYVVTRKNVVPYWYSFAYNLTIFLSWLYPFAVYLTQRNRLSTVRNRKGFHAFFLLLGAFLSGFFWECLYKNIFSPDYVKTTLDRYQVEYFWFFPVFLVVIACFFIVHIDRRIRSHPQITEKKAGLQTKIPRLDHLGLTEREKEIVALAIGGDSNEEMAQKLCIAKTTVKSHLKNVYEKIRVKNRIELIVFLQNSLET